MTGCFHNLFYTEPTDMHGSHISGLTNFPNFSSIFPISSISSTFYLMNLPNRKIHLTNKHQ